MAGKMRAAHRRVDREAAQSGREDRQPARMLMCDWRVPQGEVRRRRRRRNRKAADLRRRFRFRIGPGAAATPNRFRFWRLRVQSAHGQKTAAPLQARQPDVEAGPPPPAWMFLFVVGRGRLMLRSEAADQGLVRTHGMFRKQPPRACHFQFAMGSVERAPPCSAVKSSGGGRRPGIVGRIACSCESPVVGDSR